MVLSLPGEVERAEAATDTNYLMELTSSNFNQLVALFLSEAIRTRRTSLTRAAEISQRVVSRLPFLRSESGALAMLTDIEKDFEEISVLKKALHFGYEASDIKVYEKEIKDYASEIFVRDIPASSQFLQDASDKQMTIQQLCLKYPGFCDYLQRQPEQSSYFGRIGSKSGLKTPIHRLATPRICGFFCFLL